MFRILRQASPDLAALVLRIGLGTMFMFHGAPKLLGGPELWAKIGAAMGGLGITFAPAFWGLMAGLAEFGGGLLLVVGFLTRPACAFLTFTMLVAWSKLLLRHDDFNAWSQPAEDAIAFAALFLLGPGRHRLFRRTGPDDGVSAKR
ncbi:DoxX family protein [Pendulispora albinea]|uniref:DoxX family protein n=1 Tax=Pendulispora albinea TaxID=2741071 RepID=A0ABZ2MBE6_9BACT